MALWRFLTLLFIIFALLFESRVAYGLAAVTAALFYILPRLQRTTVQNLVIKRSQATVRLYSGEEAVLKLTVENQGWFPLAWVSGFEHMPLGLGGCPYKWVVSLSPREQVTVEYPFIGRNRGVYEVGPIQIFGGDHFGLTTFKKEVPLYHTVVVYPECPSLVSLSLPSNLSLGNIRVQRQIYPDPSRLAGVRPYRPGDPLKTVHWKAAARTGTLQVKQFEHTVTLNVMICLNMDEPDYDVHTLFSTKELAIETAAAVASHLAQVGEVYGFATLAQYRKARAGSSGQPDVFQQETGPLVIPPGQGQGQLMEVLTALAGIECQSEKGFGSLVDQVARDSSYGSVVVLIVPEDTPDIVEQAYLLARLGLHIIIIVVGKTVKHQVLLGRNTGGVKIYQAREVVKWTKNL